jgi:hypothetical protein
MIPTLLRSLTRALSPLCAVCLVAATVGVGCGPRQRGTQIDLSKLPPYTGTAQSLFNDNIEPAALGVSLEKPSYKGDATFRQRVQSADVVARVKVTTVTIGKSEEKTTYHLQLELEDQPFSRQQPGQDELEVSIPEGSYSYSVMNLVKARARGRQMIGMWKRFREGEEQAIHWYFVPEDPDSTAAVKEALALQELSRP